MKKLDLSAYNLQTKIYWSVMLCLSVIACGFALYKIAEFSFVEFLFLGGSLVVSSLISKYQFKIKGTQTAISAKELIVFWGTIWLGIPGAILLAAGAALTKFSSAKKSPRQWLFDAFVNTVSACAAATVFYLTLYYSVGFAGNQVAGVQIDTGWFLAAAGLMAFTHFFLFSIISSTFLSFEGKYYFLELWKNNFGWTVGTYLVGAVAALLLHYIFLSFGLGFGWIVLPIVVTGHFAYQIHLRRLAQKTKEIREASRIHLATVEALATAIDARDQVGIGHVRRTQIYAVGIGKILGLSDDELQALNAGALLHDIGKLAVPDHILNKPGRLTSAEMEKVKIHSSVGASILEKINFPYPVIPTIKYHHEMYDGSGYPEGLKANNIPLTARILAVADAFDTLRGARPYRDAVSRDEARKFLLNGAGTQFDPKIVDVFLRNLRTFETEVIEQGFSYKFDDQGKNEINTNISEDADQSYVEQIKRANREVFSLYELARVFSSSLNLQDTLSLFVDKVGEFVPFDTCIVYLSEENKEFAKAAFTKGKNSSTLKNKRVKAGEGATGFVLKKRQPIHKVEPGLDFSFHQLELAEEYTTMASLPLISEEKLLGAVSLYSCEMENYEEEHMRLLETVSRIASDAICMTLQHAESETRALTDPMTSLPNARSLQMQFEKEAGRAGRNGGTFQLLMLDLDGFKAINDTFGHKVGDALLKEIGKVMRGQLRDYDFLARYAGDEFVAIVPDTDNEGIQELCERMAKAVSDFALPVSETEFARVGVSLGAACFPHQGETLDQIVIAADKGMYAAKARNKQKQAVQNSPALSPKDSIEAAYVVELDESHIISSAIN
ncbi:hypothetical protein BH20ACI1_BH20ACI1_04590 [soil metagenome]